MSDTAIMIENWLTRKPRERAAALTALFGIFLWGLGLFYLSRLAGSSLMPASAQKVFVQGEYWRLWTALFAHADIAHLISNGLLFLPFAFFLTGYFSLYFFPFAALLAGGVINFLVLKTLGPQTTLLGISGVVYWMGGSWLTLYFLIDKRRTLVRRLAVALGVAMVLFAPETYKPEISYLSHFLGFVFGSATALIYFLFNRRKFEAAEVYKSEPVEEMVSDELAKTTHCSANS